MNTIAERLFALRQAVADTAQQYGRASDTVHILAISKTHPSNALREALAAGQHEFGENYVQEALDKIRELAPTPARWHFVGPTQSNKTQAVAAHFDWVHSVDRWKIAERLHAQRPDTLPPLNVCLQVNISEEDSKSGVAPSKVAALAEQIAGLSRLRLRGLMAIPAPLSAFDDQRRTFARLRDLQEQLITAGFPLDTLSMGMSADWPAAIAEGATIIRLGTAIFGERARPVTITSNTTKR
jgi:PLP dependent protein